MIRGVYIIHPRNIKMSGIILYIDLLTYFIITANHTLSVSAFLITNTSLKLTCSSSDTVLQDNQYLKWTEKGRELPEGYLVVSSSGEVTVSINNASYLDIGVYTCRCYNNYSVAEIEEIYYSDHKYYHHCSEPFPVTAALSTSGNQLSVYTDRVCSTLFRIYCSFTCRRTAFYCWHA